MVIRVLLQIDSYCQSNGLVIAGYYQGNENLDDARYVKQPWYTSIDNQLSYADNFDQIRFTTCKNFLNDDEMLCYFRPTQFSHRILERMKDNFPQTCLFMVRFHFD